MKAAYEHTREKNLQLGNIYLVTITYKESQHVLLLICLKWYFQVSLFSKSECVSLKNQIWMCKVKITLGSVTVACSRD